MRTRRSPRNQESLFRRLFQPSPGVPARSVPSLDERIAAAEKLIANPPPGGSPRRRQRTIDDAKKLLSDLEALRRAQL